MASSEVELGSWRFLSKCRGEDPELFYAAEGARLADAKRICSGCPVLLDCRAYNDGQEDGAPEKWWFGVWGGQSPQDRIARRAGRPVREVAAVVPQSRPKSPLRRGVFDTYQAMRATGASVRQLRYWDKMGLAKPSVRGGGVPGRTRLYSSADLERLCEIVAWVQKRRRPVDFPGFDPAAARRNPEGVIA